MREAEAFKIVLDQPVSNSHEITAIVNHNNPITSWWTKSSPTVYSILSLGWIYFTSSQ